MRGGPEPSCSPRHAGHSSGHHTHAGGRGLSLIISCPTRGWAWEPLLCPHLHTCPHLPLSGISKGSLAHS